MKTNLKPIHQMQEEIGAWSRRNFGNQPSYRPLLGAVEELGELAHAHLKSEQGIRGETVNHIEEKVDALGDIMIYLMDYAEREAINLDAAVRITWEKVRKRDWIKNPETGGDENG